MLSMHILFLILIVACSLSFLAQNPNKLEKLMEKPMLRSELTSLKEQIKGQMALSEENNLNVMMMMGRSLLDYNRVPSLTEVFKKIDAVTSKQIQQVAQQVFQPEKISTLIMHP